jgi:hypothetical protein
VEIILDKLAEERIFTVEKVGGGVKFTEGCDRYFEVVLSKEEMRKLAGELDRLALTLED